MVTGSEWGRFADAVVSPCAVNLERLIAHFRLTPPADVVRRARLLAAALLLTSPGAARAQFPDGAALLASNDSLITIEMAARMDGLYWIGSVTKQFVAAESLRLAERGAHSLDDSIGPTPVATDGAAGEHGAAFRAAKLC